MSPNNFPSIMGSGRAVPHRSCDSDLRPSFLLGEEWPVLLKVASRSRVAVYSRVMRAGVTRAELRLDLLFAVAASVLAVSSVLTTDPSSAYNYPPANVWLVLLALGTSLPIAIRRVAPLLAVAVSLACVSAIMLLRWNEGVTPLGLLACLYAVAVYRSLTFALAGLVMVLGSFTVYALAGAPYFDNIYGLLDSAIFVAPWAIGLAIRRQRLAREAATQRAVEAERAVAVAEERAVFAERLRIAREMHDVVSHTLSVVTVRAGVARHLLATNPQEAEASLAAIETSGRSALDDLRRMLGVLRTPGGDADGSLSPVPGLADLDRLAQAHREAWGPVALRVDGGAGKAPESVRLTVFRIIQEALTNVSKHAPRAAVRVDVREAGGDVTVEVDNDPAPSNGVDPAVTGGGFGLIGMQERVWLFGGRLETGPTPGGGFRVHAVLPQHGGRQQVVT